MKKKKIFFILAIILIIIIMSIFILNKNYNNKLVELTIEEVIEKINNKDNFALCISQTTCIHCANYKPKLNKVSKNYNIEIFYIDIDKYNEEEKNMFKEYISFDGSTPVTVFIKDGGETTTGNRIFGDSSYDKIVKKFRNVGFIK